MARRDWGVIKGEDGTIPGDESSMSRAIALANRFDAATIESLADAMTAMDRFGGQLMVQVRRSKYDAEGAEIPQELHREVPGQWVTDGFIFSYESRDRILKEIDAPDEIELEDVDTHPQMISAEPELEPETQPEPELEEAAA